MLQKTAVLISAEVWGIISTNNRKPNPLNRPFMKKNSTLILLRKIVFLLMSLSIFQTAFSQPDYDFRNPSLISGTDRQLNAVYLFQNVKPGVDATVTIKDITGGIILNDIDGPSGYAEALQPILQVPAGASGYIEFEINFLVGGTSTPMIQTEIPCTPIDIDGQTYSDGKVKEFDVLQLTNGYVDYDMLGGELNMTISGSWATGKNVLGVDYPGVDTAPRQVMFTTVNAALSKFTFRTGATSWATGSHQRLRSLYFKKFFYPNSFLPLPSLSSFTGNAKDDKVVLTWNMLSSNTIKEAVVERADNAGQFSTIATVQMATGLASVTTYGFTDNNQSAATVYYRLKLTDLNGKTEYSNVLLFRTNNTTQTQSLKIYPSVIDNNATVNFLAAKNEATVLRLFDINGRTVYQKKINLSAGSNAITINDLGSLQQGSYIAALQAGNTMHSQKIIIK